MYHVTKQLNDTPISVEKISHASPALSFDSFFMGFFATWLYKSRECTHRIWYQSVSLAYILTVMSFVILVAHHTLAFGSSLLLHHDDPQWFLVPSVQYLINRVSSYFCLDLSWPVFPFVLDMTGFHNHIKLYVTWLTPILSGRLIGEIMSVSDWSVLTWNAVQWSRDICLLCNTLGIVQKLQNYAQKSSPCVHNDDFYFNKDITRCIKLWESLRGHLCMYITCGSHREKSLKLFDKLQTFFLQWKRGQWGWNFAGHLTHITYIYQKRISLIGLCFVSRDRITWSNTVTTQHRTTTKKLGKIVAIQPCKSHYVIFQIAFGRNIKRIYRELQENQSSLKIFSKLAP